MYRAQRRLQENFYDRARDRAAECGTLKSWGGNNFQTAAPDGLTNLACLSAKSSNGGMSDDTVGVTSTEIKLWELDGTVLIDQGRERLYVPKCFVDELIAKLRKFSPSPVAESVRQSETVG